MEAVLPPSGTQKININLKGSLTFRGEANLLFQP